MLGKPLMPASVGVGVFAAVLLLVVLLLVVLLDVFVELIESPLSHYRRATRSHKAITVCDKED
jgi:hypothetical protein